MTTTENTITNDITTEESIRETLARLKSFLETNASEDSGNSANKQGAECADGNPLNAEILKKFEAFLKSNETETKDCASAVSTAHVLEDDEDYVVSGDDEGDEDDEDDDGNDERNDLDKYLEDSYFWNPGPEWKTIGLVAGGAALLGLGVLITKWMKD